MRWLASRFMDDIDDLEDLGILTQEVRARKEAQQSLFEESNGGNGHGNGHSADPPANGGSVPATSALTDAPPVIPAKMSGTDLGPACEQCGGMMQRTGSCYTCSSCGNNTGCG
jgi:ribonucleoside-diphosphate reductase alpha chain